MSSKLGENKQIWGREKEQMGKKQQKEENGGKIGGKIRK